MLQSDGWHSFKLYRGHTAFMSLSRCDYTTQWRGTQKVLNMKVMLKVGAVQRSVIFVL